MSTRSKAEKQQPVGLLHCQMSAARSFHGSALWPLGEPARSVLQPLQSFSPVSLTGLGEGGLELV